MIHPLFTVDMLRRLYMFSNVLNFIEAVRSIYQNVQYFITSKVCFEFCRLIDTNCTGLAAIRLQLLRVALCLYTSAVKRNYDKNYN